MDKIQKNLEVYLEEKRTEFPRFYFISNDELLQLLAEQKEISKCEKHLNKLFDNVSKLFFAEDSKAAEDGDAIYGIISSEREEVKLFKPVKKHNMSVEGWLVLLKKTIKQTVHTIIRKAATELKKSDTPRTEWVLQHHGQAVTVVSKIRWTEMVEEALLEMEEDSTAIPSLAK